MTGILIRILRRDATRNKIILAVIFTLVTISAFLLSSGAHLIVRIAASMDALFERAQAPHVVQMHTGELDRHAIETWAAGNPLVSDHHIVEMITVDGSHLFLGATASSEAGGVMDISFVVQNHRFDLLLDLENNPMLIAQGEIGVPLYYRNARGLAVGDQVRIDTGSFTRTYRIAGFLRDAQMNPAVIHSKRFLIHHADFAEIRAHLPDTEYLIESRLTDPARAGDVAAAYTAAELPSGGPIVDHRLFRLLNALTDGMVAAAVIMVSLLLMLVAVLCLRFTIAATIEEDFREIGVMKAIGMSRRHIRRIYLMRHIALGVTASATGYLCSFAARAPLSANATAFLGTAEIPRALHAVPVFASALVCLMIVASATRMLNRIRRISAVEALRGTTTADRPWRFALMPLRLLIRSGVSLVLGVRDVAQRPRLYGVVVGVFALCCAIILVPYHFHATVNHPSLITYMGIGRSDIRIDLRQIDLGQAQFDHVLATIAADPDITRYAPLVTVRYPLLQADGTQGTIAVETGDFTLFPLEYIHGSEPRTAHQIALSVLNARDLELHIGDTLVLVVEGEQHPMTVSGIYQDVTNGGRTAKAPLPRHGQPVLRYALVADVHPGVDIVAKTAQYAHAFHPARVTDLDGYIAETMGGIVGQLSTVVRAAATIGVVVTALMTALFLKMLLVKDRSRIAVMQSIGFSLQHIRLQYHSTALTLLAVGIASGTLLSNTLGPRVVGLLWSFLGAARIRFIIHPLPAYLLFPLLLAATVALTTVISVSRLKDTGIATAIAE